MAIVLISEGDVFLAAAALTFGPASGIWHYLKWRSVARGQIWIDDTSLHISIPDQAVISYRRDEILSIRLHGYFGWGDLWRPGTWQDLPMLSIHGHHHGPFLLWRDEAEAARRSIHNWWKNDA